MERLTKQSKDKEFYVTDKIDVRLSERDYYGDAVEKLAKFENLCEHLAERKKSIPMELENLRNAGKSKTVTFKELLAEKMIIEMIFNKLEIYGLK